MQCEVRQSRPAMVLVREEILGRLIHFHLCTECVSKISGDIKLRNVLAIVTSIVVVLKSGNSVDPRQRCETPGQPWSGGGLGTAVVAESVAGLRSGNPKGNGGGTEAD